MAFNRLMVELINSGLFLPLVLQFDYQHLTYENEITVEHTSQSVEAPVSTRYSTFVYMTSLIIYCLIG